MRSAAKEEMVHCYTMDLLVLYLFYFDQLAWNIVRTLIGLVFTKKR